MSFSSILSWRAGDKAYSWFQNRSKIRSSWDEIEKSKLGGKIKSTEEDGVEICLSVSQLEIERVKFIKLS